MVTSPARSKHQPPSPSDWFSGSQNSRATPVVSWYQAGNPPILGSLLTGPTRSRAAWAGRVRASIESATDARTMVVEMRFEFLDCIVGSPPEAGPEPPRTAPRFVPSPLNDSSTVAFRRYTTIDRDQA